VDSHYSSRLLPRILRVREITQLVPDWNVLVNLEPEELAGKLLFVLRKSTPYGGKYHLGNLMREFWMTTPPIKHPYESAKDHALIELAIAEAWAYLEAQGLLISSPEDGQHGWRVLSRRARKFESEAEFAGTLWHAFSPKRCFTRVLRKKCGWLLCAVILRTLHFKP
jgi:hypothetical protein